MATRTITVREWFDMHRKDLGIPEDATDDYHLTEEQLKGVRGKWGVIIKKGLRDYFEEEIGGGIIQVGFKIETIGDYITFVEAFI